MSSGSTRENIGDIELTRSDISTIRVMDSCYNRELQIVLLRFMDEQRSLEYPEALYVPDLLCNLAASGMPVKREGEETVLSPPPTPIDVTELRRSKLNQLLNREARRMWTPTENWLAISAIAAGVPLLLFFGVGVLLIPAGADLRKKYNKKIVPKS